jgi:hypothetical protein
MNTAHTEGPVLPIDPALLAPPAAASPILSRLAATLGSWCTPPSGSRGLTTELAIVLALLSGGLFDVGTPIVVGEASPHSACAHER